MDNASQNNIVVYSLSTSSAPDVCRYIGYTKKIPKIRLCEHLSESRYNRTRKDKWIQQQKRKNNQIILTEIDSLTSIEEAKIKEIEYIKLFKSFGAKLVNGTNGGDGAIGLKHTDEFKEWNRITKSKEVFVFDYNTGRFIIKYDSITSMWKDQKLTKSRVSEVLSGKSHQHKGLWFGYSDKFNPPIREKQIVWNKGISTKGKQKFRTSPVIVTLNNNPYEFASISDASIFFNVHRTQLCRTLKTGIKYKGSLEIKYKSTK